MMGGDPGPLSDRMNTLSGLHPNTERLPQWTQQETRDLISIRADLERDFNVSKRNKTLWEVVAGKMRERGYRRSSEQCKCKWKNLVNRYKSKETADPETGRSCPFFEELHAVFTERAMSMQKLLEAEAGTSHSKKKPKRSGGDRSDEDLSSDNNEDEEESEEEHPPKTKRKKPEKGKSKPVVSNSSVIEALQEIMEKQQIMDYKWQEMMERRGQERRRFEQEWRQTMEKMERERLMSEQAWREREEQRRMREETRAEKRDALLTALLNKLIHDDF